VRFRFRMERVLDFVRLNETVKKMEVSSLVQQVEALEKEKVDREATIRSLLDQSRDRWTQDSSWIPYQTSKVAADARDINRIDKKLVAVRNTLEEKKFELGRLAMKRKAMENLKEKRKSMFRVEETRREQKTNDELYRLLKKAGT
jgi:flagellar export protein FliJ